MSTLEVLSSRKVTPNLFDHKYEQYPIAKSVILKTPWDFTWSKAEVQGACW